MGWKIHLSAAAVLTAAVPIATWGLVGPLDEQGYPPSELDYPFKTPSLPSGLETALGVIAPLLAVANAALLLRASLRGTLDRRWWWQVLCPLIAVGLIVGWGWRVITAGTYGANIGGGLVILFGVPMVVILLLIAVSRGIWLATRGREGEGKVLGRD